MNPMQLLPYQKQRLMHVPNWLGSVLIHLLILVIVVKIGYPPTRKTEVVWVSLSNTVLKSPEPADVPQPKNIAPEQAVPQATVPVTPEEIPDRAALTESLPVPEEQFVSQNTTIEPKLSQPNRPAPLKIRKPDRVKQKMARPADSANILLPQGGMKKETVRNAPPVSVRTRTVPVETKEPPASVETPAAAEARYRQTNFAGIRSKVSDNLRYPTMARRQGWQGQVQVRFKVLLSGDIDDLRILSSSGYSLLDRQALQAVKLAAPFPAPPVVASIIIPVTFKLNAQ